MGKLDEAGRTIAGLIGYNPGPGIYSRLERAIEAMPDNVRVQELPGLLKRYKEGVPGWEVKEVLTPDLIGGAQSIPRQDLLDAVKERSPVYTHKEIVLGGRPQRTYSRRPPGDAFGYERQAEPSRIGEGVSHSLHQYADYGQGGDDYTEILLTQPGIDGNSFGSHWVTGAKGRAKEAVAHARFDTHGDALRINELQSDLGIHNRKIRESGGRGSAPPQLPTETDAEYLERISDAGWRGEWGEDGEMVIRGQPTLPFPLEDAWSDILIKRLALEAARGGHRAIEVASPRAIADKVGGNIDNYEHFYGKVVPGALERLGRKMGGLELPPKEVGLPYSRALSYRHSQLGVQGEQKMYGQMARMWSPRANEAYDNLVETLRHSADPDAIYSAADDLHEALRNAEELGDASAQDMQQLMAIAARHAESRNADAHLSRKILKAINQEGGAQPGKRYIMSDEMRKRILTQGIGAAVAAPIVTDDELIERLNQ